MNKKSTALILAGAILLSGCSAKYRWSRSDKNAAAVMIAGNVADGATTAWAMRDEDFAEGNTALFGDHPSDGTIVAVKVATIAVFLGIAHVFPRHRKAILLPIGCLSGGVAAMNTLKIMRGKDD
jgi:hypothetical protein